MALKNRNILGWLVEYNCYELDATKGWKAERNGELIYAETYDELASQLHARQPVIELSDVWIDELGDHK